MSEANARALGNVHAQNLVDQTGKMVPVSDIATSSYVDESVASIPKSHALHVKDFGVVGDYNTDDTEAFEAAINAAADAGKCLILEGIIRLTRSIELPEFVGWDGGRPGYYNTWLNDVGNKPLLRPGYKAQMAGTCIVFSGNADDYSTYTTNRADQYSSFTYGMSHLHVQGGYISGVAFVQDVNVYDADGNLTTPETDNRTALGCGFLNRGQHFTMRDCNIFGYWGLAGRIIHSQQDLENIDSDYNRDFNVMHTGISLIAGDSVDTQGLTGYYSSGCMFHNAADYHQPALGDYNRRAIFVDGNNGIFGSRGHHFDGSLRTRADVAVELDRCDDVIFNLHAIETPSAGVSGSTGQGKVTGTSRTVDVRFLTVGFNGDFGIPALASQASGKVIWLGGVTGAEVVVARQGHFVKMLGGAGSSRLQMGKSYGDATSSSEFMFERSSSYENLSLRFNNSDVFSFGPTGDFTSYGNAEVRGQLFVPNVSTTSQAANAYLTGSGGIQRSTSALKYKDDVKPLDSDTIDAAMSLNSRTYVSKCDADDKSIRYLGFIADEADDLGLRQLVNYGDSGEVEGFAYDRMSVIHHAVIKSHEIAIQSLAKRIEQLENREV